VPLYPILDTALLQRQQIPLCAAVEAALSFSVRYVQIRHKGAFDRTTLEAIEECAKLPHQGRLILNDRADYARMLGLGLHVGQDDLPPAEARAILGQGRELGFSTHNAEQLSAAPFESLSYVALGPIFGTRTKEKPDPEVGLENLRAWRKLSPLPLVAIGGITLETAPAVLEAGADFVSIISALWPAPYTLKAFGDEIDTWLKTLRAPDPAHSKRDSAS
jgi:thiamine-phosphate pyrophosphorylase